MQKSVAILILMAGALTAGSISETGTLSDPNGYAVIEFSVSLPGTVTIETWGFGGGTNAAGTVIPAGGFDPFVTLFSGTGPTATVVDHNDDGTCATANPNQGYCFDSFLSLALASGTYTLVINLSGNAPLAAFDPLNYHTLGDGFMLQQSIFGYVESDTTDDDYPLDGHWAVDIFGESVGGIDASPQDLSGTPEPAMFGLAGAMLGALVLAARRRSRG